MLVPATNVQQFKLGLILGQAKVAFESRPGWDGGARKKRAAGRRHRTKDLRCERVIRYKRKFHVRFPKVERQRLGESCPFRR